MTTHVIDPERERAAIRAELNRRRMLREAGAIADLDMAERQTERDATAAMRQDKRVITADRAERRRIRDLNAARNRDRMRSALDHPMTGDELLTACQHATLVAKVPPERMTDIAQSLAEYVIRRHGPNPPRVKVTAAGLRKLAVMLYLAERRKDERATGARAAAEQLAEWRDQDHRAAMADAAASGDLVYALAGNRPVWDQDREVATAEQVSAALDLTYLQRDAVRIALSHERRRGAAPLPGKVRVAFHAATAILRKRFHTADAVRCAIRPASYSAMLLADAAIRAERKRAGVAARGGHLAGRRDSASTLPLSRMRPGVEPMPGPRPIIGQTTWTLYGNGYSGACALPRQT